MTRRVVTVLAAAAIALSVPKAAGGRQKPTFKSRVDAITVDALVSEGGRPVRGLAADDFEVLDNGVPQRVALVGADEIPLNVVLVIDTSESVKGERLRQLQAASHALIDDLNETDSCAVLTFGEAIELRAPLRPGPATAKPAVTAITAGGSTPLYDATYAALVVAESSVGRTLEIVFSDGADTASYLTRDAVADVAHRTGVVVYAVTAGLRRQDRFLRDVARETAGSVIEVTSGERLDGIFGRILREFRQRYLLSYEPRGVVKGGWHRLEVRVKNRRVQVKARAGYMSGE